MTDQDVTDAFTRLAAAQRYLLGEEETCKQLTYTMYAAFAMNESMDRATGTALADAHVRGGIAREIRILIPVFRARTGIEQRLTEEIVMSLRDRLASGTLTDPEQLDVLLSAIYILENGEAEHA